MTEVDDSQPVERNGADRRTLALLVVVTLVLRIAVLAAMPHTFVDDPDAYRAVGVNIVEHGCFGHGDRPSATRPLLYPLVIAACRLVDPPLWYSLAVVHLLLGLATVVLTWQLALRWGLGRWASLAAALVAIDPVLLVQSTLVMTETLATLLAVAGLLAATRCAESPSAGRAALCAILLAAAGLCRPTFLVWMAPLVVLLPLFAHDWRHRARLFVTLGLTTGLVLAPWMIRNAVQFGKPTPATNHGGFTLLLANNPDFYEYLHTARPGELWDADNFNRDWKTRSKQLAQGDEVAADRLAYADALATIRSQPGTFAYACLVRLSRLWGLVPHSTSKHEGPLRRAARWSIGAFYAVEFLLAVLGLIALVRGGVARDRFARGWVWGLLLVAAFTVMHAFYWSNIRMRAPLVPVVCVAASLGVAQIVFRRCWHKSPCDKDLRVS